MTFQFPHPQQAARLARHSAGCALALALLTGCGGSHETQQASFTFGGGQLAITNHNANIPVTLHDGDAGQVTVSLTTTTAGKSAADPGWSLTAHTLDVGNPCAKGYVGICEGSYTVTVPRGTAVTVNGVVTPVR